MLSLSECALQEATKENNDAGARKALAAMDALRDTGYDIRSDPSNENAMLVFVADFMGQTVNSVRDEVFKTLKHLGIHPEVTRVLVRQNKSVIRYTF